MLILELGFILVVGLVISLLLEKIKIPGLTGLIIFGILISSIVSPELKNISPILRQIALIIILTRSGLSLNINNLKKVGLQAILMCFIPATFEIVGTLIGGYYLLHLSIVESLLLGAALAAVSPAVISPRMINYINNKLGTNKNIPELILAGSSVDDIFCIILFYVFLGLVQNNSFDYLSIIQIPTSIILGVLVGLIIGFILIYIFKHIKLNNVSSTIIILGLSFILVATEELLKPYIKISMLLSVMVIGMVLLIKDKDKAKELSNSYNNLWNIFQILLFVLVGAAVDFSTLSNVGYIILTLVIGLSFRVLGVLISISMTKLNYKEKIFVILAYLPKATVQASIGGIALSVGLNCGGIVLAVSVISILITAPIGALLLDNLSNKLLTKEEIIASGDE